MGLLAHRATYIGIIWFYDPGKMDDTNLLEIRWIDGRNPAR